MILKEDFLDMVGKCKSSLRAIGALETNLKADLSDSPLMDFVNGADVIFYNLLGIELKDEELDAFFSCFWSVANNFPAEMILKEGPSVTIREFDEFYDFWIDRPGEVKDCILLP